MGMGSIDKPMANKVNHIENRVDDLAGAEGDTLKRLANERTEIHDVCLKHFNIARNELMVFLKHLRRKAKRAL